MTSPAAILFITSLGNFRIIWLYGGNKQSLLILHLLYSANPSIFYKYKNNQTNHHKLTSYDPSSKADSPKPSSYLDNFYRTTDLEVSFSQDTKYGTTLTHKKCSHIAPSDRMKDGDSNNNEARFDHSPTIPFSKPFYYPSCLSSFLNRHLCQVLVAVVPFPIAK